VSGSNLAQCPDCGGAVSALASACPHCGRPSDAVLAETACDRCGELAVIRGAGLRGWLEPINFVVWCVGGALVLGIGYYFWGNSREWCESCGRRPFRTGFGRGLQVFLLLVGLYATSWSLAFALGAGDFS
jgi:hypothetical protein